MDIKESVKTFVKDYIWDSSSKPLPPTPPPVISVNDLPGYNEASQGYTTPPYQNSTYDGEKFPGGFGVTQLFDLDYWTLRQRSSQLFTDNLYARGLIRRLITNEINTGLSPEATPDEEILNVSEDSLSEWSETIENRFEIYGKNPRLCDWKQVKTFGAIQREVRMEALISGDVLVVMRQSKETKLPLIQLISGDKVRTPFGDEGKINKGHEITHGVETDKNGLVVAHWVTQKDLKSKRIPAYGRKTGRKLSWLVYGTEKRLDALRGEPLLSIVLQSLKEIDRYRDSVQRKAVVNSILAMFITKTQDRMGSLPMQGGAIRKDSATVTDGSGATRSFKLQEHVPGLVIDELQQGELPVFNGGAGTDINFGTFEEAIIQGIAWANEIPPEILRLAFSNNYSASQAAINEFKIYLNRIWTGFGEEFCTPIYIEWLVSELLLQKVKANGLLEAWRDPLSYDILGAWTSVEWYGSIKPSTDMLKQAKGSTLLVNNGWSTNAKEARGATGTKYIKNIKRLKRENELKVEALKPLAIFRKEFEIDNSSTDAIEALDTATLELVEALDNAAI